MNLLFEASDIHTMERHDPHAANDLCRVAIEAARDKMFKPLASNYRFDKTRDDTLLVQFADRQVNDEENQASLGEKKRERTRCRHGCLVVRSLTARSSCATHYPSVSVVDQLRLPKYTDFARCRILDRNIESARG